jgi:hypothetical protein
VVGRPGAHRLTLEEVAALLRLPVEAIEALVSAGYLLTESGDGEAGVPVSEAKAFVARNTETEGEVFDGLDVVELREDAAHTEVGHLATALRERTDEMADRALEILATAFPEVASWPAARTAHFLAQTHERFDAILAISTDAEGVDDELLEDMVVVGGAAAAGGTPLPEVLLTLRVSRDLIVQMAVEVAQGRGAEWTLPLALLLMRVLPALDRMSDAITQGWWDTTVNR